MSSVDLIQRLRSSEPIIHSLNVDGRYLKHEEVNRLGLTIYLPEPIEWTVTFDETTRPYGSATLTYPTTAYNWDLIDPTSTQTRARLFLQASYTFPLSQTIDRFNLGGHIVQRLTHSSDGVTIVNLESDESLIEDVYTSPSCSYAPGGGTDLASIISDSQEEAGLPYMLDVTVDDAIDPKDINFEPINSSTLEGDVPYLDWLYSLIDAAGLYIHSNQREDGGTGLIIEHREKTQTWGLDLRSESIDSLVTSTRVTKSVENAASTLDLTVEWKDAGKTQSVSKRYRHPTIDLGRIARRTLKLRPPLIGLNRTLPDYWAPALDLLDRLAKRTWEASIEARSCYWLRPRDPISTDQGDALIASITFTGSTGLMTITARPY